MAANAAGGPAAEEARREAGVYFRALLEVRPAYIQARLIGMEDGGREVVRCFVKGAPDVLLARSSHYMDPAGSSAPLFDEDRQRVLAENDRLAAGGMRVLAVAQRDFDPAAFDPAADLLALVADLELVALIGIVDPPRKEAKDAIALCHDAGIRVRMITGDHATTAAAIAAQLGIEGRALTGAEFAALPDDQLLAEVDGIGVVARVAPEDKVRLVSILKRQGNIVAMTGDGVNDAPALTRADIGVAMGITGTEVTKDAAEMILTDDIRHDRGGGRGRAWSLRQPDEVHPGPDDHAGRLHPHLCRRRDLQHRQRLPAPAPADPVDQLRGRRAARPRTGLRRTDTRADASTAPVSR
jgi:magnesium-transporting ATPase (P-type)